MTGWAGCGSAEKGAVKQTWTEDQDEELKMLFDEFTQLPPDAASEHGQQHYLTDYLALIAGDISKM